MDAICQEPTASKLTFNTNSVTAALSRSPDLRCGTCGR